MIFDFPKSCQLSRIKHGAYARDCRDYRKNAEYVVFGKTPPLPPENTPFSLPLSHFLNSWPLNRTKSAEKEARHNLYGYSSIKLIQVKRFLDPWTVGKK